MQWAKNKLRFEIFSQIVSLYELRASKTQKPTDETRAAMADDAYKAAVLYTDVFIVHESTVKRTSRKKVSETEDLLETRIAFNKARTIYPGKKRGNETEFAEFIKKHKDHKRVAPLLFKQLSRQIERRDYLVNNTNEFVASWANFSTWISQRRWEEYVADVNVKKGKSQTQPNVF